MNLKTLECLDSGDPSGVVRLRPCTVVNSETQIWRCSSSHGLYVMKKGNRSYLDYSGLHFYTGGDKQVRKWIANKGTGVSSRSICDIPDSYKGWWFFLLSSFCDVSHILFFLVPFCIFFCCLHFVMSLTSSSS